MTTKGRPELQELIGEWRARANVLRPKRYIGSDDAANATETCADELEAALRAHPDLRAWVQHKPECNALHPLWCDDEGILRETKRLTTTNCGVAPGFLCAGHSRACTCGLDVALRSLEEGRQAQTEASAAPQEEK